VRTPDALHVCGDRVRVTPLVAATAALVGSYRAEPAGEPPGTRDEGARLLTLRLSPGDSAVVELQEPDGATARRPASWAVEDSIVIVRLDDVRPFTWIVGGAYLRPLAWDTAAFGPRGVALQRVP
ncbi:MAG TPA: hypothetical protein VFS08_09040, partial [Gemmatimonadaceae bacterium]|nr:hypothetical protein [Gemmatimonadaceae bacterium]